MPTTSSGSYEVHPLASEDDLRMRRLSEEIRGRLQEMALIASRTARLGLPMTAVPRFVHRAANAGEFVPGSVIEIVGSGSDQQCIIYCTNPVGMGGTVIAESPCGSAGPNPCEHAFPD